MLKARSGLFSNFAAAVIMLWICCALASRKITDALTVTRSFESETLEDASLTATSSSSILSGGQKSNFSDGHDSSTAVGLKTTVNHDDAAASTTSVYNAMHGSDYSFILFETTSRDLAKQSSIDDISAENKLNASNFDDDSYNIEYRMQITTEEPNTYSTNELTVFTDTSINDGTIDEYVNAVTLNNTERDNQTYIRPEIVRQQSGSMVSFADEKDSNGSHAMSVLFSTEGNINIIVILHIQCYSNQSCHEQFC
jgi:hypothetical protein